MTLRQQGTSEKPHWSHNNEIFHSFHRSSEKSDPICNGPKSGTNQCHNSAAVPPWPIILMITVDIVLTGHRGKMKMKGVRRPPFSLEKTPRDLKRKSSKREHIPLNHNTLLITGKSSVRTWLRKMFSTSSEADTEDMVAETAPFVALVKKSCTLARSSDRITGSLNLKGSHMAWSMPLLSRAYIH